MSLEHLVNEGLNLTVNEMVLLLSAIALSICFVNLLIPPQLI